MAFVTREFKEKLRTLGRVPDKGFYINRIWLTKGKLLGASASGPGESKTPVRPPRRGGRRGGRTGQPPPGKPQDQQAVEDIIDPVTEEVMNEDYEFDMVFDVVLADLPESALEKEATEGEEGDKTGG